MSQLNEIWFILILGNVMFSPSSKGELCFIGVVLLSEPSSHG